MTVTLKNGWEVTPVDSIVPLRKNFFANNALGQLLLCSVKGYPQVVFENGCSAWIIASTARTVDGLEQPLDEYIIIRNTPLENNPTE